MAILSFVACKEPKVRFVSLLAKHVAVWLCSLAGILHHCALGGTSLDTVVRTTCMNGLELHSSNIKYQRHVHVACIFGC